MFMLRFWDVFQGRLFGKYSYNKFILDDLIKATNWEASLLLYTNTIVLVT